MKASARDAVGVVACYVEVLDLPGRGVRRFLTDEFSSAQPLYQQNRPRRE
jgi:hypothetical protein